MSQLTQEQTQNEPRKGLTSEQTRNWLKWIAALKSGKYVQAEGQLKAYDGSMCCLGVLCEVVQPNKWEPKESGFLIEDEDCFLPASVQEAVGMPDEFGFLCRIDGGYNALSNINDGSFNSEKPDYSNVLPHIEAYLREHGDRETLQAEGFV